jgi:predicted HicB family RNase H-like nuclease
MTDKARDPRALNSVKRAAPATAQIQMRVVPEVKNRYVVQARREGMKLSEWIQHHLDAVCQSAGDAKLQDKNTSD